ncbi:hypothetical protein [Legionella sp. WA2022007384]
MEKDEHQPNPGSGESKTSSTALTLLQFRKEEEKKEAAAESAKVRCKICFKEIAPTPRCFGHGGGGGGGGDGSGSSNTLEAKAIQGDDKSLIKAFHLVVEPEELIEGVTSTEELDSTSKSDEELFDPEIIAELIAEGLLVINNDRESLTLSIQLQCDPKSLSEEQREELKKFMKAILNEFKAFQEQHFLSDDCINMSEDEEGNILSLSISLPTLALYDAFIQQLSNNLVPTPKPTKDEHKEAKSSAPTPFSMKPAPSNKRKNLIQDEAIKNDAISIKKTETEDEVLEIFNPSPSPFSKMKRW